MEYLEQLNQEQRKAVEHVDGPLMVIAGAGSGKTRVLTYRIAHLINMGVDPFSILALTFTNKAAREMKERISKIIGDKEAANIWMGTFHSVFARILRMEADRINYPRNFTIYDTQDSRSVIKDVIKSMNLDDKVYKPATVYGRISAAKNNLIGPAEYRANTEVMSEDHQAGRPKMADIYAAYAERCYRAGAMDFDDLLYKTNVLMRDHPDILHRYQHKFQFILVDEYQDTNFAQYLIIKQLGAVHHNVCVVGDDAQSIYSFRGADIGNILNFKRDYPDFAMYKLEQNYRSTKVIVNAANSVIEKNKNQIKKTVWTDNDQGDVISVHRSMSDGDEGRFVAERIFETRNNLQVENKEFAILYRTNSQSRSFEESLRKLNIPYRIYGGLSFYQRKEIKDLLAYYRLTANHADDEALKRVVNYPARGIGKTTMERLTIAASNHKVPIWKVIQNPHEYPSEINGATQGKLRNFATMIESFAAQIETKSAFDLGQHIADSTGLMRELYSDKTPEGVARYENIQELLNGMKEFSDQTDPTDPDAIRTMADFLVDVALLTDADKQDDDDNKVNMMTIHASKGLEFDYVFVVGLEENLFPSQLALNSRDELEEERRLFYVALTRARKQATLTYAITRYRWGQLSQCEESRFIEEIDPRYVHLAAVSARRPEPFGGGNFASARQRFYKPMPSNTQGKTRVSQTNTSSEPIDTEGIVPGAEVEHARFGKGKVLKLEGDAPNIKAIVFFPKAGQKQLLLKFAKLKVL
ncbi:ATP-dependent helicase [Sanyastnella coralliicola]|uniref:ATP-dependent helicase n=1 Tax=Sanyastnella coralliicola TaxID=3069118 RepID=UPI0027B8988D|nr:UvrD-helicase domain-containing protein [Longitalea sp. SCSIO 12813]